MNQILTLPREDQFGLLLWAALVALQVIWHAWLFPPQLVPTSVVLALTVIPLLLPLFALRHVRRALLWVGMLSLFYFCHGVAEAWTLPGVRWVALAEIILTVLLIGTLGVGVRHPRKPGLPPPR